MRDAAKYNAAIAEEFEVISECGPLSAYVDTKELEALNLDELDKIKTVFVLCVLTFAIFACECCTAVSCLCCGSGGRSGNCVVCRRHCGSEFSYFLLTLYKEGG